LIVGVLVATEVAACPAPDQLHVTSLDRAFTQEKFMSGMSKPLKSEGRLLASADEVVWHMTKPFDVKTTITGKGISQSVDGKPAERAGPESTEVGASIAKAMAALMRGQWSELKTMFTVKPSAPVGAEDWQVLLTPLDQRLQSVLGTIVVRGCEDVSLVEITRPDGDRETIVFSESR
jgi:hypothetical protein